MSNINISTREHLSILGKKVRDRVTGMEGIATSVCFDLYGCVQTIINPGTDKDGKVRDQLWFDINRLLVLDNTPVMAPPAFDAKLRPDGPIGPAEKPSFNKN